MKIKLNDIFSTEVNPDYSNWEELTKGKHTPALNLYKRMPYFTEVSGRTPLLNFQTNPFKEEEEQSPWRDLVFQDVMGPQKMGQ